MPSIQRMGRFRFTLPQRLAVVLTICIATSPLPAEMLAGVAKVDITDREAGPVNDPLYVKALVLKNDATTAVIITVDAVAIGEIGPIGNDYLANGARARSNRNWESHPANVLVNASHCHGVVRADVDERTVAGGQGKPRQNWCRSASASGVAMKTGSWRTAG